LSRRGRAAVARLERTRYWPSAVADALRGWSSFLADPAHRLFDRRCGCEEFLCCPDPYELRATLDAAVAVLPPRDARLLRRRLQQLDDLW
jgi:hypothetical protein